ncbi:MAG TPA: NADH-quinone oxidoreductase subunit C [Aromatoleum sp.]|uniref:NADH-quinone oxidoreductase subunit D-related protein n=1 Tax=Aromatoleum sp. TaxID=2307007 RepID=UPI002B468870|nr:NADH-quinone oxidoreductase subunit C [Aromatoleum sp.]HJV25066.1 NADH-quinone oxidoreductase subunit C [Aromatoleum sp.]
MNSRATKVWPLEQSRRKDLDQFVQACRQRLGAGDRLVTLFGRQEESNRMPGVVVTAIFQDESGELQALHCLTDRDKQYSALTPDFPAAHIFERELWEQTGLTPEGHPWLKPVRFEGKRQGQMAEYPFFSVRGQEIHEVGVGPIHAGVIEPGHFRFMCLGEQVHHLEIQLGYQHRGVEQLLLRRNPMLLAPVIESICGDSAVAYSWGFCAAIEALAGYEVTPECDMRRAIGLELERIAIHAATLSGMATDIAFLQGGGTYGRLRTAIINAVQRVSGNRFGRGWIRLGKSKPFTDTLRVDLIQTLAAFLRDFDEINQLMLSSQSVKARLKGTGVVTRQAADELGLIGVAARASGRAVDARVDLPNQPYQRFPIASTVQETGDCWGRMKQRMEEVDTSVAWLLKVLQEEKPTAAPTKEIGLAANSPLKPDALAISVVEGPRGAVVQAIETSQAGRIVHYKVQDPSLSNWFGVAMALRDNEISDFPICNKSFDLSYCGNDL